MEQDIHITDLQQLCDVIVSTLTKISEESFQNFVESMTQK